MKNQFNLTSKRNKFNKKKKLRNLLIKGIFPVMLIVFPLYNLLSASTNNNETIATASLFNTSVKEDVFTVCIDAGHGDWDYGTIGLYSTNEKDVNLDVALKLGEILENKNINVIYTRISDSSSSTANTARESLYERVNFSDSNNADLFISIHCNSYDEDSSVNGVETWYNPNDPQSIYFAELVQDELSALEYTTDRGIITYAPGEELVVVDKTDATSVLIELGFLSNYYDVDYLTSTYGQAQCAAAISSAVLSYMDYYKIEN